ncbi:MAG: alpha-L-fucosidase [Anaerolineae bacterium]|nr:alpha-L-fucosidase [Thermoflexales bacterium]MDW8408607.1 alpha-L-fucosidase [Anaerolineae bacterium]
MITETIKPTSCQLAWQDAEFGLFCHFGINTFYDKEWSDGSLSPAAFNPTRLNTRQWVEMAKAAGARYLIFTAKHHDGFCLWQTETTDYSVRAAPWKDGQGDVVAELAQACHDLNMPLGLYLSPWDRHEPCYGDPPTYDRFYVRQLTELCTRYGPLFELWFDGAGSEGRTYNWEAIIEVVNRYQPNALVFNMGRPTIRWVGNEDGLAADPCYYVVDSAAVSIYTDRQDAVPKAYMPPECDVPIRQHWFWHADDLHTLKSKEHLLGIYYRSVGLGANLLLNVPPNREGLLDEIDCRRLLEVADEIKRRFADPIPARLTQQGALITLDFGRPVTCDHLILQEDLRDGQRVDGYTLRAEDRVIAAGCTIGHKKIHVFPAITAQHLSLQLNTEAARILSVDAYHTGHEHLPALDALFDPALFESKMMR